MILFAEPPLDFEQPWNQAQLMALGPLTVRVAAIPDLIPMKQRAGRPVDLEDIRHLAEIERRQKGSLL